MTASSDPTPPAADAQRADLLATFARYRGFLVQTVQGLTDEQAGSRPTVSELCLGGLNKHVGQTERQWVGFAARGPEAFGPEVDWASVDWSNLGANAELAASFGERAATFQMAPGETLAGILAEYEEVAADTERAVAGLDLDASHPLPSAPWFEPGAEWSVRRALLHMIAETAQHAGHADILRESIDGAKTMG